MNQATPGKAPAWANALTAQARSYLSLGHDAWRKSDPLADPSDEPGEDELSARGMTREQVLEIYQIGMGQLAAGHGLSDQDPLQQIDIGGFNLLLRLLHYKFGGQKIAHFSKEWVTDEMTLIHEATQETITLFNKVPSPMIRMGWK